MKDNVWIFPFGFGSSPERTRHPSIKFHGDPPVVHPAPCWQKTNKVKTWRRRWKNRHPVTVWSNNQSTIRLDGTHSSCGGAINSTNCKLTASEAVLELSVDALWEDITLHNMNVCECKYRADSNDSFAYRVICSENCPSERLIWKLPTQFPKAKLSSHCLFCFESKNPKSIQRTPIKEQLFCHLTNCFAAVWNNGWFPFLLKGESLCDSGSTNPETHVCIRRCQGMTPLLFEASAKNSQT